MAKRKATRKRSSSKRSSKALSKALNVPSSNVCKGCGSSSCHCQSKGMGWILLILGVLYLIRDLGGFQWWTISWWSVLFILFGLWMIKK